MKLALSSIACVLILLTGISLADDLPKPWQKFYHDASSDSDYYFNPKEIIRSQGYIDARIIEILRPKSLITIKQIRFDTLTGFRGYGEVKIFKNDTNNLISQFRFDQGGYQFSKPNPEEKRLYSRLQKH